MHNLLHKKTFLCLCCVNLPRTPTSVYQCIYLSISNVYFCACVCVCVHSKNISNKVWHIIVLNIFMKKCKIWDNGKKCFTQNNVPSVWLHISLISRASCRCISRKKKPMDLLTFSSHHQIFRHLCNC